MRFRVFRLVRGLAALAVGSLALNMLITFTHPSPGISESGSHAIDYLARQRTAQQVNAFRTSGEAKAVEPHHKIFRSSATCPDLQIELPRTSSYEFQKIGLYDGYVYSAFSEAKSIKILGVRKSRNANPRNAVMHCQLWYRNGTGEVLHVQTGTFADLPESHGKRFTATFLQCPVPPSIKETPMAVSISLKPCEAPTNVLHILAPPSNGSRGVEHEFVMCITPLNMRYSRAYELVDMMELNKILGAGKVVFYNHSTGPNVDTVLNYYKERGEAEVLPWKLPMHVDTWPPQQKPDIHYFGQLASHNDCLYRYRHRAKWLVYQDLDEFIIPRTHENWSELVGARGDGKSSLLFRCVFFRKEWPQLAEGFRGNEIAVKFKSVVLRHTLRESQVHAFNVRSKFIIDPLRTSIVGIHNIWRQEGRNDQVPSDIAMLHHYRNWENPKDKQGRHSDSIVVDKFGSVLVNNLAKVWATLGPDVSLDIDIKAYGSYV